MLRFYYLLQVIKDLSDLLGLQQEAIMSEARLNLVVFCVRDMLGPFAALAWREEAIRSDCYHNGFRLDGRQSCCHATATTTHILAIDAP